uniref:Transglycosylase SLT domain-containing protein n=1 Tax=uncultured bacterium CSLC2 TaxID=1091571 RepID=G4WVS7_9BACT|nr:hypothetical protein [uncultured bacterium CSLC2]
MTPFAAHAGIPFFGPIIPASYALCAAGWGLLILVVNNIISLLLTLAIVFVAPLSIAYAGFLFVVNPVNSGGISQAKEILKNTVVGIVIALAAWLIVDAIMVALTTGPKGPSFAQNWKSLISGGGDMCITLATGLNQATQSGYYAPGVTAGALNAPPAGKTGTACDPSALQQSVPSLSTNQANLLSCLAQPESVCGSRPQNYSWNVGNDQGLASTAYGPFQILLSSNHAAFENPACQAAAGVTGQLNCQNGFDSKGFTTGGNATVLEYCKRAASNLTCSTIAAKYVLDKQGASAWLKDPNRVTAQRQCIIQYGN